MNKPIKKGKPKAQPKQVASQISTAPFHFKGRNFHIGFILVVIAFCFAIYGNGISNGFSLDDEFVIHNDTTVTKGLKGIPKLFKMRYAWDQKGSYGYRPLVKVSFAIEDQFFGASPHAGHVINILIYAGLCIFLFYFLRKLLYEQVSDYFLLLFLAIFIAHPIHTEVVDSLKNRDMLMTMLFGLYCTYAFVKAFETNDILKRCLWIVSAVVSYYLGVLCKEDEYLFLGIVPLVLVIFTKPKYKAAAIAVVSMLFSQVFFKRFIIKNILPHSEYHRTYIFIEQPLLHTHWYQRISLGFYSLWFYVRKLIFPKIMACYYGYSTIDPQPKWTDINVLAGIAITVLLGYVLYRNRKDKGTIMFSLLMFIGTTFAFVNILKVGPGIVADRFTFTPSIGFILLFVLLLFHLFRLPFKSKPEGTKTTYLYLIVGTIVVIYSARTIERNPNWESHLSIYEHDVKEVPHSAKLQSLLAASYIQKIQQTPSIDKDVKAQYYQLAENSYNAAVDVFPGYTTSLNNLGMIQYNYHRNLREAIAYFDKALSYDSTYTEALFNKGAAEEAMGKKDEAENCYLKAIRCNPEYYLSYAYISHLYFTEGRLDKVIQVNESAINGGHPSDIVYANIGNVYMAEKDTTKAVDYFEKALQQSVRNLNLAKFVEQYYAAKKDMGKTQYYQKLIKDAGEQAEKMRNEE
jgi:tetratricopeptide (TPR) repeat protein